MRSLRAAIEVSIRLAVGVVAVLDRPPHGPSADHDDSGYRLRRHGAGQAQLAM
ncbi:MAG: hypothetical protein ABSF03_27285 [Streptosporangiaceae bacterium]